MACYRNKNKTTNSVAWVCERTIPTERPPLLGEVSANFLCIRVPLGQRDGSLRPYSRLSRPEPLLFLSSSSSVVLSRQSRPHSRATTSQNSWWCRGSNAGLCICSQEPWLLDHRGGYYRNGFTITGIVQWSEGLVIVSCVPRLPQLHTLPVPIKQGNPKRNDLHLGRKPIPVLNLPSFITALQIHLHYRFIFLHPVSAFSSCRSLLPLKSN
jgi:hypothetical protein